MEEKYLDWFNIDVEFKLSGLLGGGASGGEDEGDSATFDWRC